MFIQKGSSDTLVVVLHEIYGINHHMQEVCRSFYEKGYDSVCPNLLDRSMPFDYSEESLAYNHFMSYVGFDLAVQKVKKLITESRERYTYIFLVGYSVGATIVWLCSHEENLCDGVIGYYGSRIRDYKDRMPKCPALLLFAKEERAFNVETVMGKIKIADAAIHLLDGTHGFADPYSKHYNEASYREAEQIISLFLAKVKK